MKSESSVGKILWSVAYLCLAALALKVAITSQPLRVGAALQQNQRKSLEQAFSSNPQVRVNEIKIGSKVRQFKEEFDESDDWPRRLTLEVENITTKPIVYLAINFNFPETKSSGNLMSYVIPVGVGTNLPTRVSAKPLHLKPGERLKITLDEEYNALERFIGTRHPMNQIRKAQIEIGFIVFEDGIAWTAGDFLRLDPNNPKRYINIGHSMPN